jgi:hypothetical protein
LAAENIRRFVFWEWKSGCEVHGERTLTNPEKLRYFKTPL